MFFLNPLFSRRMMFMIEMKVNTPPVKIPMPVNKPDRKKINNFFILQIDLSIIRNNFNKVPIN